MSIVDKLGKGLRNIGLDTQIVASPSLGEKEVLGWVLGKKDECLGFIEIIDSPIRRVNIVREEIYVGGGLGGGSKSHICRNIYVVPDQNVSTKGGYRHIESVRVRNIPLIGRIVDIRWEGELKDYLLRRLNEDVLLNRSLIKLREDITIRSFLEYHCWSISTNRAYDTGFLWSLFARPTPSRTQWECYEIIARHLLESSGK